MAGRLRETLTFPKRRVRLRCTSARKMPPLGGIVLIPSKACRLTAARGQNLQCCGPCHLCPACHGYPVSTPSQGIKMHEGSTNPRLTQELRLATDLALRATEVTVQSLGKGMSTLVVQERHLWVSLVERAKSTKYFLDALVFQAGLFSDTVEDRAAVLGSTEADRGTSCPSVGSVGKP